ncbi:unnamed protein product [Rhizophagus irregularis]|nr:unnamed protein product [Rhizophagus irregularis]
MYELISGLPPYYNIGHDENLAIKICQGLRPRFNINVPQLNRPKAIEICEILREWAHEFSKSSDSDPTELKKQIKEVEGSNNELFTSIRNSDDYYKQNNNIISKEYSESLLINIVDSQQSQQIDISPQIDDSQQIDISPQIGDSTQINTSLQIYNSQQIDISPQIDDSQQINITPQIDDSQQIDISKILQELDTK